jgi:uncharacterized protein (TIGR02117 family)
VISHGWHTDLAIPASDLTGGLAQFRRIFPGARTLVIGFGRRTFLIAPVRTWTDFLIGPFPGNGAMQVLALSAPPTTAYDSGELAILHPTAAQRARLNAAIWSSFATNSDGTPERIAPGLIPGSIFYASTRGYSGLYTCNSWTADMLSRAGYPITSGLDIFAAQTMQRAAPATEGGLCALEPAT